MARWSCPEICAIITTGLETQSDDDEYLQPVYRWRGTLGLARVGERVARDLVDFADGGGPDSQGGAHRVPSKLPLARLLAGSEASGPGGRVISQCRRQQRREEAEKQRPRAGCHGVIFRLPRAGVAGSSACRAAVQRRLRQRWRVGELSNTKTTSRAICPIDSCLLVSCS